MQPKVVITRRIRGEVLEMLSRSFVVVPNMTASLLSPDDLQRRTWDARALVVGADDLVNSSFLDQCPYLKIVASTFNGPGLVDVQACSDHGVWFSIVDGFPPETKAQLAASNVYEALLGMRPKGALNDLPAPFRFRKSA
jgi:lactate dehydrogenase-like 2-hydroxyacid dehydrogenase